jgi:pyruvate dehydrogenase E2 component (dihydrolipoamide acetyltransferase)
MSIEITMPALSPTMTEGKLARWLKKEGDQVKSGDVLAEIETDKATMEVEAVDEGFLAKILVPDGTEGVAVNAVIGVLTETKGGAVDAPKAAPAAAAPAPKAEAAPALQAAAPVHTASEDRIFASPLAKRIAKQSGIDLASVKGSGPNGRIVKADLDKAPASAAPAPAAPAPVPAAAPAPAPVAKQAAAAPVITAPHKKISNSSMRKVIAKRSVNDLVIKASALALRRHPMVNSSYTEEAIIQYDDVDISIAVAIPDGLITPIIRKADQQGLAAISNAMKDLGARAKAGKLKPEEFQGGGFSISNLGMFGIAEFSAIINPPQSAILAVGAGEQRAVVKNGALAVATVMTVTLSCDHRVVDGALGAEFLATLKSIIEDPLSLML